MGQAANQARSERARRSLEGLSVGDAFGERFFCDAADVSAAGRRVPRANPPWVVTDDTVMALSIVEVLETHGQIEQDPLATAFARRYAEDPGRGYGAGAHRLLTEIGEGRPWRTVARSLFGGRGSWGNGGAMRAAPLGAWWADDLDRAAEDAARSAEVTHAHSEGQAGAVAVAVAAALAAGRAGQPWFEDAAAFIRQVADRTPPGATGNGLLAAADLPPACSVELAVSALGNGSRISAPDTVPLCVWAAAWFGASFEDALWKTVSALGDRDTTCAIVGGIVGAHTGPAAIPAAWRAAREPLPW